MITHALGSIPRALGSRINGRTIRSLFRRHSPGIWYDPQDLTTLYQDAKGTLPVYRPGTGLVDPPVGLALDRGRWLELGPELKQNAVVAGTVGYAKYDSGLERFEAYRNAGGHGGIAFNPQLAPLKSYLVEVELFEHRDYPGYVEWFGWPSAISLTGHGGQVTIPTGGSLLWTTVLMRSSVAISGSTLQFNLPDVGHAIGIRFISVREIKGYHAYQNTPTARPTLSGRYNLLTATETLATQSVTTAATNYTLSFSGAGTITLSGTATGTLSAGTHTITCTVGTLTCTVAGSVTRADLRVKRDGSSLPAYQRVVNATTYDTAGFPLYLRRDRVDDDLIVQAPAITGQTAWGSIDTVDIAAATIAAGAYKPFGAITTGEPTCTQWIAIDGTLTAAEQAILERYAYSKSKLQVGA